MLDLPAGASLIPNPINRRPGFSFANGHGFPGFPEITQPMMKRVLAPRDDTGENHGRCTLPFPGDKAARPDR